MKEDWTTSKKVSIIAIVSMIIGWLIWGYCFYFRHYFAQFIGITLFAIGSRFGIEYFREGIKTRKFDIIFWIWVTLYVLLFLNIIGFIIYLFKI